MKRLVAFLLCLLMVIPMLPVFSLPTEAAGKRIVFLRTGGNGDGSSPDKPLGNLTDAYNALDLTKDCKIVLCGAFTFSAHFSYGKEYSGSVTITSLYNGYDYGAKKNATFVANTFRFVLWGKTKFENIKIRLASNYFYIIARCHPITIGEGVDVSTNNKVTGHDISSGLSIIGGYQVGQDMPPYESRQDMNITVLSGEKIVIGAFNRGFEYAYNFGKANITVGGNAKVGAIFISSIDVPNVLCGDVELTVKDQASVEIITGERTQPNVRVNSFKLNWLGGTIGKASLTDGTAIKDTNPANTTFFENKTYVRYDPTVVKGKDAEKILGVFDIAVAMGSAVDTEFVITTDAPIITQGVTTGEPSQNTEGDSTPTVTSPSTTGAPIGGVGDDAPSHLTVPIIIATVVVACAVICILVFKKKKA